MRAVTRLMALVALCMFLFAGAAIAGTLDTVKERGYVNTGVSGKF